MDVHQPYLLAGDVVFLTPEILAAADKQALAIEDGEVVITYINSRKRSKVVTKGLADLLQHFSQPQTITKAIFVHAEKTSQDPQRLAEMAFPILLNLQQEGFLVAQKKEETSPPEKGLNPGDTFGLYTITDLCQHYENSAVYRAKDKEGSAVALKIFTQPARPGPPADYTNEITILSLLDNRVNPALRDNGEYKGQYYLATEWCEGLPCEEAAKPYRNFISAPNVVALLELCAAIANAYQHLHQQGILHGDIHPANILIGKENRVCIIDYGNAVKKEAPQRTIRGGIDFYYEPELAKALLNDDVAVPITEKSEQYALAVLLYRLFTGHFYLPFSYEEKAAYRQIAEEPPSPFSAFSLPLPVELEAVFQRALAKEPADRFPDMAAFAVALQQCRTAVEESRHFFVAGSNNSDEKFVRFLVRRYGLDGSLIAKGLQLAPTASVNNGAAGIAYFLYRAACVWEEPAWLDAADVWAGHAGAYGVGFDKAFYAAGEGITENTVGRRSLYHSPTGVHLVQAMISRCRGDVYGLQNAGQLYLQAAGATCHLLDLTLGKAGLLVGSALLLKECLAVQGIETGHLLSFTKTILDEVWQQVSLLAPIDSERKISYYGIAHGWGGILYATLFWCAASGQPLPQQVLGRLEELLAKGKPRDGALEWPVSNEDDRSWLGWCHGNAGYVFLWSQAFRYFREERFRTAAVQSGAALFNRHPQTPNLCCGWAGEAYALLNLYELTGETFYLEQAKTVGRQMLHHLSSPDLRQHSLYKGEVGIGLLLCELARPELARMPLFS